MRPNLETVQPVLMSRDVSASIDFFEKLGFTLEGQDVADDPKYARMCRENVEIHFQWHDAQEWAYPKRSPVIQIRGARCGRTTARILGMRCVGHDARR